MRAVVANYSHKLLAPETSRPDGPEGCEFPSLVEGWRGTPQGGVRTVLLSPKPFGPEHWWCGTASRRPAPGDFRPCLWHFGVWGALGRRGPLRFFWRWGTGSRPKPLPLRAATPSSLCAFGLGAAPSCPGALRQGPVRAVAKDATPDIASLVTRHATGRRLYPAERTVRTAPSGKQREHYTAGGVGAG